MLTVLEMLWEACPGEVAALGTLTLLCSLLMAVCLVALFCGSEEEEDIIE